MEPSQLQTYNTILTQLYLEHRSYREKEFQTFLFAFPILGSGLVNIVTSKPLIIMLSLFGLVICNYLVRNINRLMRIRKVIVTIQQELQLNDTILKPLNPVDWSTRSFHRHLGTITYLALILMEIAVLWIFKYPQLP